MVNNKGQIPWNKGKTLPNKMRKAISIGKTGTRLAQEHKEHIAISQKKRLSEIKQCSACSIKSKWIYNVRMPFSEYVILLCDADLVDQFHNLTEDQKKQVEILS